MWKHLIPKAKTQFHELVSPLPIGIPHNAAVQLPKIETAVVSIRIAFCVVISKAVLSSRHWAQDSPSRVCQNPRVPTLIAWLPGLTGATLLSYMAGQAV